MSSISAMDYGHWLKKEHRDYLQQRKVWEQSLTQDTYTVEEAAKVLKRSTSTIRRLIREGELYAVNQGERTTIVPKAAIVNYMVPYRSFLDFYR